MHSAPAPLSVDVASLVPVVLSWANEVPARTAAERKIFLLYSILNESIDFDFYG